MTYRIAYRAAMKEVFLVTLILQKLNFHHNYFSGKAFLSRSKFHIFCSLCCEVPHVRDADKNGCRLLPCLLSYVGQAIWKRSLAAICQISDWLA